jgi:dihydroneopterin aldolase
MTSQVGIKGLKLSCKIGVDTGEDLFKRVIRVDIKAKLKGDYKGDLSTTVSYSEIAKKIKENVEGKEFKLIEDIAVTVAKIVSSFDNVRSVSVKVIKYAVPAGADYAYFVYSVGKT